MSIKLYHPVNIQVLIYLYLFYTNEGTNREWVHPRKVLREAYFY